MPAHAQASIRHLTSTGAAIRETCRSLTPEESRWREAEEKWSILEIVNHLLDEEILDFRTRLSLTISDPSKDWPPIDPKRWVIEKDYQNRDLGDSLEKLAEERGRSIEFLESITDDELGSVHPHPTLGEMRAGDILHSWVAHDLLHLRQIARVRYRMLASAAYDVAYAGRFT